MQTLEDDFAGKADSAIIRPGSRHTRNWVSRCGCRKVRLCIDLVRANIDIQVRVIKGIEKIRANLESQTLIPEKS